MRSTWLVSVIGMIAVGASGVASAQGVVLQRPIQDFVDAQGQFPPPPGFTAGFVCWIGRTGPMADLSRIMTIDYAGLDAEAVGLPAPEIAGSVEEKPIRNGQTNVKVTVRTRNALAYVHECGAPTPENACPGGEVLFGISAEELKGGADPSAAAYGSSLFEIQYNVSRPPGAPMEDLIQMFFGGTPPVPELPYDALPLFVGFSGGAKGSLRAASGCPEGTLGQAWTVQTGLIWAAIHNGFKGALVDAFPAEWVEIRPECN